MLVNVKLYVLAAVVAVAPEIWTLDAVEVSVQPAGKLPSVRAALAAVKPAGAVQLAPMIGEFEQKSKTILFTAVGAVKVTL